jgi:hypothetical protein
MSFDANFAACAAGSFPHKDPIAACDLVLSSFPEIPFWPQLPAINLREQMEIQYSEGLPCAVIDDYKGRMFFDTGGDVIGALEGFYENYLSDNLDYFAISSGFANGIGAMESRLTQDLPSEMKYFKMQVTGPISFALSIVDENKRAIYYNDMFRDVIVKGMAMKARWQLRKFKPFCLRQICVIDEPILSAFGSSTYVSVRREDVVAYIGEVVEAIHNGGALAGIHCCGNTEWTIPMDAGVDIINFDAYQYGESILLYPKQMQTFLEKGGVLSWGIVPTSKDIDALAASDLVARFEGLAGELASKGVDRGLIQRNAMITASCGTGTVPLERSESIARTTKQVSDMLKDRYC